MSHMILIAEDDPDIRALLELYLKSSGYQVQTAANGIQALEILRRQKIDLALLDIMMPETDGISAMIELRKSTNIPVILLTAKSEDSDKILGLNVGADDYITKPFNPVELLARVRSCLRRYMQLGGGTLKTAQITIGEITLDDNEKSVTVGNEPVSLTPTEFEILKLFMTNPGKVFSPKEIYKQVWNDLPYGS